MSPFAKDSTMLEGTICEKKSPQLKDSACLAISLTCEVSAEGCATPAPGLIRLATSSPITSAPEETISKYISAFVIKNQGNAAFTNGLNLIKEGVILYQGIKFTADINELGKWNSELTIFLSTEHLFNALGFNGILYQQIFDDFDKLVSEINFSGTFILMVPDQRKFMFSGVITNELNVISSSVTLIIASL